MTRNKIVILLIAGSIASGLGAIYYTQAYIDDYISDQADKNNNISQSTKVVVANINLEKNEVLDYQNLSIRELPVKYVHSNAVLPDNVESVIGKPLLHQIKKGEVLLTSFVNSLPEKEISKLIEEGERAVTIRVDNISSVSGLLRPGHKIDIILTMNGEEKLTRPVLKNVTVLATGDQVVTDIPELNSDFNAITISVTPVNASRIVLARNLGSLSIVLRSPKEISTNESELQPVSINNLFGKAEYKPKYKKRVEIIVEGN